MADLGQQTVDFSILVTRAAGESYSSLKELVEQCRYLSDAEKKISLLKFINKTQQRMLRLDVLSKWCQQVPLINYCQQLASTLSNHETCFTQAADSLFFMHDGLQQARAPIYDVPSATEILLTGTYQRFPKCVEEIGAHGTLPVDVQQKALKKLDTLVRSKLLEVSIPKGFSEVKVSDGTVLLSVDGEYKVLVTLGYRGHLNLWRILHLELLVGEKNGTVNLEDSRRYIVGDDLERRMATATDPFVTLHSVLHELCVSLIMDTVIKQVQALRQGRWKGAISFDLVSDGMGQVGTSASTQIYNDGESESVGLGTPRLKIVYWVHTEKAFGTSGLGSCPYIIVETGSDMQMKCSHSSFVVDPLTGKEAEFSLETSCIDVEKLLLRAIHCNIYTRLLEIQRQLVKNSLICQTDGDIVLQGNMEELNGEDIKTTIKKCEGKEILRVRAYGSSYFLLGISIRTGQFHLQLSRNFLAPLALLEFEESLDQGNVTAAEVFISLRSRSVLHLFASIGRFLGLKVYENGILTLKVPKNMFISAASLLMGFPDRGGSYFLLLQLDNNLKPLFQLLKCQSDANVVVQVKTIDTDKMPLLNDEVNLSLLGLEKGFPLYTDKSRHEMLSVSSLEISAHDTRYVPSTYSSFVDGVFEHLKGATTVTPSGCSALSPILDGNKDTRTSQKRKIDDIIRNIPSLSDAKSGSGRPFKRKGLESVPKGFLNPQELMEPRLSGKSEVYSYADCMAEGDKRSQSNSIYVSALVHVIKHCSLSINRARLISQMELLKIPYTEEIGLIHIPSSLWFHLPFIKEYSWPYLRLQLDDAGSMNWNIKINDQYFRDLCQIRNGKPCTRWGTVVFVDNTSLANAHIHLDLEGVTLSYKSIEADSIQKLIADIHRLSNTRVFALGMKKLTEVRSDEKEGFSSAKSSEQLRKSFKIDKVGLTSLWFTCDYGGITRFVVEWEASKERCTMHVSPEHLWPHTKFLEDFVNQADIASLLDCICLTAGPLHALAAATRTARSGLSAVIPGADGNAFSMQKQGRHLSSDGLLHSATYSAHAASSPKINSSTAISAGTLSNSISNAIAVMAVAGRVGTSLIASSLLPTDVSIVLRGPFWIQIIYRKKFAINMRCFAGDQVWLQPATPPEGGPSVGGSLSCPQFRPFIMEHVAQEINVIDSNILSSQPAVGYLSPTNSRAILTSQLGTAINNNRVPAKAVGVNRSFNPLSSSLYLASNALAGSSNSTGIALARPLRKSSVSVLPAHKRGELNAAIVGLGDDGGYGGGWVPLVTLKKVLRSVLKYLGVLWLFSQLPDLLKEILGSILEDNEGALMNLDAEQPALRFFVGSHVFAVTVHRVQLNLQVLSMKRFQQQQPSTTSAREELSQPEINEICDYFSRRVASEPYDVSRVASFITLLTLPVPVLREFLKLISWKTTGVAQAHGADLLPARKLSIELSLEKHAEISSDNLPGYSTTKSNIHYNRAQNVVDFGLTAVLDASQVPHVDPAGGSTWLPYCVSVRLRYSFGENHCVSFVRMEGSHGGQAFWVRLDEWENSKKMVAQTVEANGSLGGDLLAQGRLRIVADSIQKTLELCVQRMVL